MKETGRAEEDRRAGVRPGESRVRKAGKARNRHGELEAGKAGESYVEAGRDGESWGEIRRGWER